MTKIAKMGDKNNGQEIATEEDQCIKKYAFNHCSIKKTISLK